MSQTTTVSDSDRARSTQLHSGSTRWLALALTLLGCSHLARAQEKPANEQPAASNPQTAGDTKAKKAASVECTVKRCDDFEVTGDGKNPAWEKTQWIPMQLRSGAAHKYATRFKILYSSSGLYVLFDGEDQRLTATKREDFLDLWTEDVYECFFWTDERHPVYFEYEISPLGFELPILVPNFDGKFLGWRPWLAGPTRSTRKATSVRGGEVKPGSMIEGWTAEVFIPYELLKPLANVPPKSGSTWRANFYRMDYDNNGHSGWDWARVGPSFHEYEKFGLLRFE